MDYPATNYLILETFSVLNFVLMFFVFFFLRKKSWTNTQKALFFMSFSLLTTITHYIPVFVEWFKGTPYTMDTIPDIYYLPVYPCNMLMFANLLFIPFVFWNSKATRLLATFLFIFGCFCGFFGLVLNFNFLDDPTWGNLVGIKSIVSHVFLLYTCISLCVFGYVDFRTIPSLASSLIGLAYFLGCFFLSKSVLSARGEDVSNFDPLLIHGLSEELHALNLFLFIPLVLVTLIALTTLYETKALPLEQRWYFKFTHARKEKGENV